MELVQAYELHQNSSKTRLLPWNSGNAVTKGQEDKITISFMMKRIYQCPVAIRFISEEKKMFLQIAHLSKNRATLFALVCPIFVLLFSSAFRGIKGWGVHIREGLNEKKCFLSGIARMRGGGLPMSKFFGPFSRSAFLVNKKSLFLQKCQCIELLTVF